MKIWNVINRAVGEKVGVIFTGRFLTQWPLDYYRTIHSIKTAIACLIGLGLYQYFHWSAAGPWIPITVIVVMSAQAHFGAALQKAYMRFLGTIAGVTIAVLTLLFFGNSTIVVFGMVFLSCLIFTYIASSSGNISYAGTLGGVTVVLTLTSANVDINFALERGACIILGIIIALLVSRFVFPIHAREKLRFNVATTLRKLRQLYFKAIKFELVSMNNCGNCSNYGNLQTLDARLDKEIYDNLALQPQLVEEAAVGSKFFSTHKRNLFVEVISVERRIYRLIYFICRNLCEITDSNSIRVICKIGGIENLHVIIENTLDKLASSLEDFVPVQSDIDFTNLATSISDLINELPQEKNAQQILSEHSLLFFMEQIVKELEALSNLLYKINTANNHRRSIMGEV